MLSRIYFITLFLVVTDTCIAQIELEGKKGNNGKFGFADYDDNWVIQPTYDEITEFDGLAYTFVKLKGKWGLIDPQNKTILPFQYSNVFFDEGLLGDEQNVIVVKNNKYGIVSRSTGKVFIDCIYEKPFEFTDGIIPYLGNLSVVYRNNKAGLINEKGVEFVPCIFDGGKVPFKEMDNDYFATAKQNNKTGVIDTIGHLVVPCMYDDVKTSETYDQLDIIRNKKHGIFSLTEGKEIVAPLYDEPFYFEGDYAILQQKKKYGAINKAGKVLVPFKYSNDDEVFLELEKLKGKN
jgi:WG containing repeat